MQPLLKGVACHIFIIYCLLAAVLENSEERRQVNWSFAFFWSWAESFFIRSSHSLECHSSAPIWTSNVVKRDDSWIDGNVLCKEAPLRPTLLSSGLCHRPARWACALLLSGIYKFIANDKVDVILLYCQRFFCLYLLCYWFFSKKKS